MTYLPRDDNRYPIPALRLRSGGAHHLQALANESTCNPTAFHPTTRVIMILAEQPVYVRSGDATVTATETDHYLPAGIPLFFSLGAYGRHTHLAVHAVTGAGLVHISELE